MACVTTQPTPEVVTPPEQTEQDADATEEPTSATKIVGNVFIGIVVIGIYAIEILSAFVEESPSL